MHSYGGRARRYDRLPTGEIGRPTGVAQSVGVFHEKGMIGRQLPSQTAWRCDARGGREVLPGLRVTTRPLSIQIMTAELP